MFFSKNDISKGLEVYESTAGAILVDVREENEYASGYIPGAVNVPLSRIQSTTLPTDKPLFLYCLRGARSSKAEKILRRMGYGNVTSIGGIKGYKGKLVRYRNV
jgi:rhodanese-related sulfurtransferase